MAANDDKRGAIFDFLEITYRWIVSIGLVAPYSSISDVLLHFPMDKKDKMMFLSAKYQKFSGFQLPRHRLLQYIL